MALQEAVRTLSEQNQWGVLCRALTSERVRAATVQLGSNAVPALIDVLRDDDPRIRQAACTALGQIGDPAAVPELTKRLWDSASEVRIAACTALGQIGDPAAVPELTKRLRDSASEVRIAACTALGQIGDPSAVPALIACLDDEEMTDAATSALLQIGKPAVPELSSAVYHHNPLIRNKVCKILAKLGEFEILLSGIRSNDLAIVTTVYEEMCEIGDPQVITRLIEALCDALKSEDIMVRRFAYRTLGEIDDGSTLPAIYNSLKNESNILVQIAAEEALKKLRRKGSAGSA
jgi:HEAT repeat protein